MRPQGIPTTGRVAPPPGRPPGKPLLSCFLKPEHLRRERTGGAGEVGSSAWLMLTPSLSDLSEWALCWALAQRGC